MIKAFIISKPKSGTYLCANLLKELGLIHPGLHFTPQRSYYKYDLDKSDAMHQDVFKSYLMNGTSFVENINIIPDNGLGVGHIPFKQSLIQPLSKFKLIYLHRDDEGISESYARMREQFKRKVALNKVKNNSIASWQPYCFSISFDDLVNRNITKIDELQMYLFNDIKFNSESAINNALSSPSITKSNKRK